MQNFLKTGRQRPILRTLDLEVQEWEAAVTLNFYSEMNAWFSVIQMLTLNHRTKSAPDWLTSGLLPYQ